MPKKICRSTATLMRRNERQVDEASSTIRGHDCGIAEVTMLLTSNVVHLRLSNCSDLQSRQWSEPFGISFMSTNPPVTDPDTVTFAG